MGRTPGAADTYLQVANDELVSEVVPLRLLVDREVAKIVLQPSSLDLGREGHRCFHSVSTQCTRPLRAGQVRGFK